MQCAWYMMLCNINQADLAVLFGNVDFWICAIQMPILYSAMRAISLIFSKSTNYLERGKCLSSMRLTARNWFCANVLDLIHSPSHILLFLDVNIELVVD
jgi:hypothetical protein